MTNLTYDAVAVVPIPADDVPAWVEDDQLSIYIHVFLASLTTYDASESPITSLFT